MCIDPSALDIVEAAPMRHGLQANCVVDVVPASPEQTAAVSADVRWTGGLGCSPHLIDATWGRVRAHAAEAGDCRGVFCAMCCSSE
jgi:hypothetical protein